MEVKEKLYRIKENKIKTFQSSGSNSDFFSIFNPNTLSDGDYLKYYKSWQFSGINTIKNSLAGLKYGVVKSKLDNEEVFSKDIDLINFELLENIVGYLKLTGTCYIKKHRTGRKVFKLEVLRSDNVSVQYNSDNITMNHIIYTFGGQNQTIYEEDLLIIKNYNPYRPGNYNYNGKSDMEAMVGQLENEESILGYNTDFFNNDGTPGLALTSDKNIDKTIKERILSAWRNQFSGKGNKHKIAFLDNGIDIKTFAPLQKDIQLLEQRRYNADEILGILGVPKALLGLSEGVNVGNVKAFESIFYKNVILPLSQKITDAFNNDPDLFNKQYFKFFDVLKEDDDTLRNDYNSGIYTLNEIRTLKGLGRLKDGDILSNGTVVVLEDTTNSKALYDNEETVVKEILKKSINSSIKGTEEYDEKRHLEYIKRMDKEEELMKPIQESIWKIQEEDLIKFVEKTKFLSKKKKKLELKIKEEDWNSVNYLTLYFTKYKKFFTSLFNTEYDKGLLEINEEGNFQIGDEQMSKMLQEQIGKMGNQIDLTTQKEMIKLIDDNQKLGLGVAEIVNNIKGKFKSYSTSRLNTIVRTETISAGQKAMEESWKDSGIVKGKEWYTAKDERVCEFCNKMHGKIISLENSFFKEGETFIGEHGGKMKMNYGNVNHPPLHPSCRCSEKPII